MTRSTSRRLALLATCALLPATANAGTIATATTDFNWDRTVTRSSAGASQGTGVTWNESAGFGGVEDLGEFCIPLIGCTGLGEYGAEVNVSTRGGLGISVEASAGGGTSDLHYKAAHTASIEEIGTLKFRISQGYREIDFGNIARSTGSTASASVNASIQHSSAIEGRVCVYDCGGGTADLGSFDSSFTLVSASNAGTGGAIKVAGLDVPGITLGQPTEVKGGLGSVTLYSAVETRSDYGNLEQTDKLLEATIDIDRVAAINGLPMNGEVDFGIGSASFSFADLSAGIGVDLKRAESFTMNANGSPAARFRFVDKGTGAAVQVPVEYTVMTSTFDPAKSVYCAFYSNVFQGQPYVASASWATGTKPGRAAFGTFLGSPIVPPEDCVTNSYTMEYRMHDMLETQTQYANGYAGTVNISVGDGLFDMSNVSVLSEEIINPLYFSSMDLQFRGFLQANIMSGEFSAGPISEGFGPLVSFRQDFSLASVSLGFQETAFGSTAFGTWLSFDGATASDVPEPAMLGLFGLATVGLGLSRRRRRG